MSKCNRMKKQLTLPAFELKPIDDTNDTHGMDTPARSAAEAQEISDILPHICLGSWRDAENAAVVRSKGITHVLNVAKECPSIKEQELMDSLEVVKKQIALVDAHSENILPHFEEAFKFMDEARSKGGRVLVHCRRGISRSPAIVTGYIMTKTGVSYESALSFVTGCRSSVSLNLAFREILFTYKPQCLAPDQEIRGIMAKSSTVMVQNGSSKTHNHTEAPQSTTLAPPAVNKDSGDETRVLSATGGSIANSGTTTLGITPSDEQSPNRGSKTAFGEEDDEPEEGGKDSSSF